MHRSIFDTDIGIPAGRLENIFDSFEQLSLFLSVQFVSDQTPFESSIRKLFFP